MSTRPRLTTNTIITRDEATAPVELTVLSYYKGRDAGYTQDGVVFHDDPSEIELDPEGVVLESGDYDFSVQPGQRITLTEEELSKAETDTLESNYLPSR